MLHIAVQKSRTSDPAISDLPPPTVPAGFFERAGLKKCFPVASAYIARVFDCVMYLELIPFHTGETHLRLECQCECFVNHVRVE